MIRLVIFDVDGTLVQSSKLSFLPHVKSFFNLVLSGGCPDRLKIAIATNQGGVGMRYWMEQKHFGKPDKYPREADVELRLRGLLEELSSDSQIPVYTSFRFQDKKEQWSPIPPGEESNPSWSSEWRKPAPGMLRQAMADAEVPADESLYIGDREEDQAAAKAAGCAFRWAGDFFVRDWDDCEDLRTRLEIIQKTEGQ